MGIIERKVYYFEQPGKANTLDCLSITRQAVEETGCRQVVVATTAGDTGVLFSRAFEGSGVNLVAVTHSYGFKEPDTIELTEEARREILDRGGRIHTGTMLTHGVETSFAKAFSGMLYPTTILAQTLRRFGEGVKVCCEIVMMAVDGGCLPEGGDVLAVAGTGRGADTVMLIRSAASKRFLDLKVREILAKPRL